MVDTWHVVASTVHVCDIVGLCMYSNTQCVYCILGCHVHSVHCAYIHCILLCVQPGGDKMAAGRCLSTVQCTVGPDPSIPCVLGSWPYVYPKHSFGLWTQLMVLLGGWPTVQQFMVITKNWKLLVTFASRRRVVSTTPAGYALGLCSSQFSWLDSFTLVFLFLFLTH